MGKLIALLSGSGGVWVLIAGLAGASIAGGTAGWMARGVIDAPALARQEAATATAKLETQTCERNREKGRADGNAKVTKELQDQVNHLGQVVDELEKKKAERDASDRKFLDQLAKLGETSVCGGSAVERLYRGSLQPSGRAPAVP